MSTPDPNIEKVERVEGGTLTKRRKAVGKRLWHAERDDGRWARFTNRSAAELFLAFRGNLDA